MLMSVNIESFVLHDQCSLFNSEKTSTLKGEL